MGASEMKGFIFCVIFLISVTTLLTTLPTDFQGLGGTGNELIPIDPSLLTGFAESEWYCKTNFTGVNYEYTLNQRDWIAEYSGTAIALVAKRLFFGIWLGGLDICTFYAPDGSDNGATLEFTEITADAEDGTVRYRIMLDNGDSAGYFVCYWNSTEYATATLAWASSELYFVHGIGVDELATNNIGSLLLSFLLFQTPGDMPILVNLFLGLPTWACLLYIVWFLFISMVPFLGGA